MLVLQGRTDQPLEFCVLALGELMEQKRISGKPMYTWTVRVKRGADSKRQNINNTKKLWIWSPKQPSITLGFLLCMPFCFHDNNAVVSPHFSYSP